MINVVFMSTVSLIDVCVLVGLGYLSNQGPEKKLADTTTDGDGVPFLHADKSGSDEYLDDTISG